MTSTGDFAAGAPPGRRWSGVRIAFLAGMAALLFAAVAVTAFVVIRGDDEPPADGRFAKPPPACESVTRSDAAAALDRPFIDIRPTPDRDGKPRDDTACYVIVPRDEYAPDHPFYERVYVTVQFFVHKSSHQDENVLAAKTLEMTAEGFRPLDGVGDQAYVKDGVIWMRVSNLTVNVRDTPAESEAAAIAFARTLARYLQSR